MRLHRFGVSFQDFGHGQQPEILHWREKRKDIKDKHSDSMQQHISIYRSLFLSRFISYSRAYDNVPLMLVMKKQMWVTEAIFVQGIIAVAAWPFAMAP